MESAIEVARLLARYGGDDSQCGAARVRLAILKLAEGSLPALETHVELACQDYRDVLTLAEYPEYLAKSMKGKFAPGERARVFAADFAQYSTWLNKP